MNKYLSLIVLCRNEKNYIEDCLNSILNFERPPGYDVEILVIDGVSNDGTYDILTRFARENPEIKVLTNTKRTTPCAFNIAIQNSRGEYFIIFSSHAKYSSSYLVESVATAERTGAVNAGGVFITQQNGTTYGASLVQALTTHKFGVGSSFRTDMNEGPADTVSYGCYRREIFDQVGLFDERLIRAQDYEMNRRIKIAGGKIWKNPRIQVYYYNQKSVWAFLKKQFLLEAPYNAYMWYLAPYAFAPRHAVTGVFAVGVIVGITLSLLMHWVACVYLSIMLFYALLAVASALQQAVRYRQPLHVVCLPFCFFLYHFVHGLGILSGLLRLATRTAPVQIINEPWPGAGRLRAWPK